MVLYRIIRLNPPAAGYYAEAFYIRIVKPCCMPFTTPLMPEKSAPEIELIRAAYAAFNARDIDAALATTTPDVAWPKAFEGGYVHGHQAVRAYWTRQWSGINPHVEPISFDREDSGRILVDVHQVVRDLAGTVLSDEHVGHRYTIEHGLIQTMEICPLPLSGH
ncbi:MAG: nuclear transport factor 2 family protein [Nostoc sp.]|uniref:nuclear transport factor 2 family protein n=2 Tax=unclassified Nostoc TaxID=2593658 RepID=UPI00235E2F98|nr:nuclear transport factor 2 family protein [Nostoc sp. UHCC 0926]